MGFTATRSSLKEFTNIHSQFAQYPPSIYSIFLTRRSQPQPSIALFLLGFLCFLEKRKVAFSFNLLFKINCDRFTKEKTRTN